MWLKTTFLRQNDKFLPFLKMLTSRGTSRWVETYSVTIYNSWHYVVTILKNEIGLPVVIGLFILFEIYSAGQKINKQIKNK